MKDRSISKPIFVDLMMGFLEDAGYSISYRGKKVEFPLDFMSFFRKYFLFMIAIAAASKRVTFSHLFELEFAESKRKEGQFILRLKVHLSIAKYFRKNPAMVNQSEDYSYSALQDRSYSVYNSLVEAQDTTRDSLVITTPPTLSTPSSTPLPPSLPTT